MMTLYRIVIIGSLGLYALTGFMGWEPGGEKRKPLPTSVRQSPGGHRSLHFWHTGFHGGK
jgi:hypothetical protein